MTILVWPLTLLIGLGMILYVIHIHARPLQDVRYKELSDKIVKLRSDLSSVRVQLGMKSDA